MTDDEPINGTEPTNGTSPVVWPKKFWRLAVIAVVVVVAYFVYLVAASSIRSDDKDKEIDRLRDENAALMVKIATLEAENKALREAKLTLESNVKDLAIHAGILAGIVAEATGAPLDHTTETTPITTTTTLTPVPPTTVPPTTVVVMPDDSIHAGLPPDASNPHGG